MFNVGQKVVCVNDDYSRSRVQAHTPASSYSQLPKKGVVYVIRGMFLTYITKSPALLLIGVVNPRHPVSGNELGFDVSRFRSLEEMKQSATNQKENAISK